MGREKWGGGGGRKDKAGSATHIRVERLVYRTLSHDDVEHTPCIESRAYEPTAMSAFRLEAQKSDVRFLSISIKKTSPLKVEMPCG